MKIDKIDDRQLAVIVDRQRVATLSAEQLRTGVRLDELLGAHPYLMWSSIASSGDDIGPIEWLEPVTNYAGLVPLAFLDGHRQVLALVDPAQADPRATADQRAIGIDEVRITVAKRPRTPLEELAARCVPPQPDEGPPPPGPRTWRGRSHQFNIPMHWKNSMSLDLADLVDQPIGARIGVLTSAAVEWEQQCQATMYRIADRHGRPAAIARVRKSDLCVDGLIEFACVGADLKVWIYYASNGAYVETGTFRPVP